MKNFLLTMLTIIGTFIAPIQSLILMLISFILLDTFVGIYVSVKMNGWKSFSSNKLFNIVVKSFFYVISVVLVLMIDKFVFGGKVFGISYLLSKGMSIFWTYIEVKSLDEHSQRLGNRSFWELVKELVKKVMSVKKDIKKITE
jgi:hypothetical protein